jgi:hypothetical protein
MNTLEVLRAKDLLVSARGMLILNAVFIALTWRWACRTSGRDGSPLRSR